LLGASPSRASVVPGVQDNYAYSQSVANARAYNPNCGCTLPYNLLNQVTFAGPSATTVGGSNFGSAGGVNSSPRTVEVGGKLYF
jgi:hypothetical protein